MPLIAVSCWSVVGSRGRSDCQKFNIFMPCHLTTTRFPLGMRSRAAGIITWRGSIPLTLISSIKTCHPVLSCGIGSSPPATSRRTITEKCRGCDDFSSSTCKPPAGTRIPIGTSCLVTPGNAASNHPLPQRGREWRISVRGGASSVRKQTRLSWSCHNESCP